MNLGDLKKVVAEKSGLTQADAEKALRAVFAAMSEALQQGDSVQILGFGSFMISERAERTGRNPQTGNEMTIAASKSVRFKMGKTLKDSING